MYVLHNCDDLAQMFSQPICFLAARRCYPLRRVIQFHHILPRPTPESYLPVSDHHFESTVLKQNELRELPGHFGSCAVRKPSVSAERLI